jgi:hypothetical protein
MLVNVAMTLLLTACAGGRVGLQRTYPERAELDANPNHVFDDKPITITSAGDSPDRRSAGWGLATASVPQRALHHNRGNPAVA